MGSPALALALGRACLAFLGTLYFQAAKGADEDLKLRLKPAVLEALKRLPQTARAPMGSVACMADLQLRHARNFA